MIMMHPGGRRSSLHLTGQADFWHPQVDSPIPWNLSFSTRGRTCDQCGGVMRTQPEKDGNIGINVDIHCHVFNAADIPIRGFVRHVALHDGWMSPQLAASRRGCARRSRLRQRQGSG